jgi:hypothetical protein
MKTSILRTAGFALGMILASIFGVNAQESFYDTKWEDGKMVSKTEYVMGYYGLYVQKSVSKFSYDENGDFLKKEVSIWNGKYKWNDKVNGRYPDYSESNFIPQYNITREDNLMTGFVVLELTLWNTAKKKHDNPIEKMIFQLNGLNRFNYLAFQIDNKYVEWVNNINNDNKLLAKVAE